MPKKILITGGAGFIGSNVCLRLIDQGYKITILDNLSKQIHGPDPEKTSPLYRSVRDKVDFVHGSVTDRNTLKAAVGKQDAIIHLAAETGTGQSMYEIERYTSVNIGGTALLLDILANTPHQVKKLIVASSRAIYGEGKYLSPGRGVVYPASREPEDMEQGDFEVNHPGCEGPLEVLPTDEDATLHPASVYGITKQTQEQLVMNATKAMGIAGVALRYQNVYGPGQSLHNPYTGILAIFSNRIRNGQPINVFEDGKMTRDFVFIKDVVDATVLCLENNRANGNVYNVGSGKPTSVLTVVNELMNLFAQEVSVEISGNFRKGDIRHNFADLTKIKQDLNFTPRTDFREGLKRFVEWARNQEAQPGNYEQSVKEMKRKGLLK